MPLPWTPEFADAHFNLALTYEQLGRVEEAQRHWGAIWRSIPAEWAPIAREHLAGSLPQSGRPRAAVSCPNQAWST
jgi:tetratricopeptide (TPR) repeat protein